MGMRGELRGLRRKEKLRDGISRFVDDAWDSVKSCVLRHGMDSKIPQLL